MMEVPYYHSIRFFIFELVCVKVDFFSFKNFTVLRNESVVYVFNFKPFTEDLQRKPSG